MRATAFVLLLLAFAAAAPAGLENARALYKQGKYSESVEECQSVLSKAPRNFSAWRLLGEAAFKGGDFVTSCGAYKKVAARETKEGTHWKLVDACDMANDYEPLFNSLLYLIEKLPNPVPAQQTYENKSEVMVDHMERVAFRCYRSGIPWQGCEELNNLVELSKTVARVHSMVARALHKTADKIREQGHFEVAMRICMACIDVYESIEPKSAAIHYAIGQAYTNLAQIFESNLQVKDMGKVLEHAEWNLFRVLDYDATHSGVYDKIARINMLKGNYRIAQQFFYAAFVKKRGEEWSEGDSIVPDYESFDISAADVAITQFKLRHDAGQMQYLMDLGLLPKYPFTEVVRNFTELAAVFDERLVVFDSIPQDQKDMVSNFWLRNYYLPHQDAWGPGTHAINPNLDFDKIQKTYLAHNVAVVDDFLTQEAIDELERYVTQATVFNEIKDGYLGAYLQEGFFPTAMVKIAEELQEVMPLIFKDMFLSNTWAYKFDTIRRDGINLHADQAFVNLNFWVISDEYNENQEAGGLIVYKYAPPMDWSFDDYNGKSANYSRLREIATTSDKVVVPNRKNRMVFFTSNLLHETDTYKFKNTYRGHRVNCTMLFGSRCTMVVKDRKGRQLADMSSDASSTIHAKTSTL